MKNALDAGSLLRSILPSRLAPQKEELDLGKLKQEDHEFEV